MRLVGLASSICLYLAASVPLAGRPCEGGLLSGFGGKSDEIHVVFVTLIPRHFCPVLVRRTQKWALMRVCRVPARIGTPRAVELSEKLKTESHERIPSPAALHRPGQ